MSDKEKTGEAGNAEMENAGSIGYQFTDSAGKVQTVALRTVNVNGAPQVRLGPFDSTSMLCLLLIEIKQMNDSLEALLNEFDGTDDDDGEEVPTTSTATPITKDPS